MKKIDLMILKAFVGPFILTLCVVVFIFLMQILTQYMSDLLGKDLEMIEYAKVFYYFGLMSVPRSMPLAVLLASLITFGNLGEFFELTAIKSAGISAWRVMRPILVVALMITVGMYFYNAYVAPWANLKGFSLLYDIKTTKTTLNIKEGIFYNGIPGYSIKVNKKFPGGENLKGLVIYRHPTNVYDAGNRDVILADSGRMYTINNKSQLVFELFKGNQYTEGEQGTSSSNVVIGGTPVTQLTRNRFEYYKMIVGLESFGIKRTNEDQFKYHQYMKTTAELDTITDSLGRDYGRAQLGFSAQAKQQFGHVFRYENLDVKKAPKAGKWIDSLVKAKKLTTYDQRQVLTTAVSQAQNTLSFIKTQKVYLNDKGRTWRNFLIEYHHKFTYALSCLVMFLIGAPLGAIIKKGGFGLPVLLGVLFFIISYVIMIQGDKWAKEGILWLPLGAWLSNIVLAVVGVYFINRAVNDSNLFDKDAYIMMWEKVKKVVVEFKNKR